jgi:hypothetical protein
VGRYSRLREIRRMDPAEDYERIHRSIALYEFPWDYTQGLGIAFLRDYGVPRISELLDRTQEFERAGQKRYDDTLLFGYEIAENGFESERGRAAGRHLNRIHAKYRIPNEDFLYVLATTVVGPKRWIDAFGWRRLCPNETEALALVGHRMALMMGISGAPAPTTASRSCWTATNTRCSPMRRRTAGSRAPPCVSWRAGTHVRCVRWSPGCCSPCWTSRCPGHWASRSSRPGYERPRDAHCAAGPWS